MTWQIYHERNGPIRTAIAKQPYIDGIDGPETEGWVEVEPVGQSSELLAELEPMLEQIYGWVGPGYPDLDDERERELFMGDVIKLAYAYYSGRHA